MSPIRPSLALAVLTVTTALSGPASAGVNLITLPTRERVEIHLDHADVTLVEEERVVPLAKGVNDVVFAWANTSIDPASIQLRCLTAPDEILVLSASYPPGENALTWQVSTPRARSARVRISYVIQHLDKSFVYRAVAGPDEQTLSLRQYIQLHNHANEAFGAAGMWAGFGSRLERPIGVNETKRIQSARFDDVPIRKIYTADVAGHGYLDHGKRQLRIPMQYEIQNDEAHALGAFALVPGKVRVFKDDGRGGTAFLGEDWAARTPRDGAMRLHLGIARDVVVTRTIERSEQRRVMGRLTDYDVIVRYDIENFKDLPVVLDVVESMPTLRSEIVGHRERPVEWMLGPEGTLGDTDPQASTADRPVFKVTVPARGADQQARKQVVRLHVVIKNEW